jgi:four helix bundle protein
MNLVQLVYDITKTYPKEEIYALTNQTRRAAISIPSNIAEGQGRRSKNDFLNCLGIAYGSLCELETQLILGQRLGYLNPDETTRVLEVAAEVGRLINGLCRSLETTDH